MNIRPYQSRDEDAVVALWERCGLTRPWNDPRKDIARKQAVQAAWFLVGEIDGNSGTDPGTLVGSVMAGYDGHRGWINYLGVDPDHRGNGYGRALMTEAERLLRAAGCPKINLQVRTGNTDAIAFYNAIGFAVDDVTSMGKRLEYDDR
ncbi:MAG: GNAT family acetyltransferase [Phycisphaera sp.]|nr:GNAT family acetyltransferase [Phycisphaera sp.]